MLDMEVLIVSNQENVPFEGAFGTKKGLRKTFVQAFVPMHKPNTSNRSPHGACAHPIRIIEGDAIGVVNVNQFTYRHSVTAETAGSYASSRDSTMTRANCINGIQIQKLKGYGTHRNVKEMTHMFTYIFCGQTTRHITSQKWGQAFPYAYAWARGGRCFPQFMAFFE